MLFSLFSLFACLVSLIAADIKFLTPAAGDSVTGDGALSVKWQDSGADPPLDELTTYQLFLCAGGNDDATIVQLADIVLDGKFAISGNSAEAVIAGTIGASTPKNAYFLKMVSVSQKGGTVINYSSRFSMTGMTGVFPAPVVAGLKTVSGTGGPSTVNNVVTGAGAGTVVSAGIDQNMYSIPFAEQSGPLRYASMQRVPPTKITKQKPTPLNPTSPYTIATTFLEPNTEIQSTVVEPITWSYKHLEHTGTPAAMPDTNMQKFLRRWVD